ncbi:MAG: hypothetical protein ABI778_11945, partial [Ignavibacteriota bacterium]
MNELIPKSDLEKIQISFSEIDELRTLIGAGESPSFDGISDIRMILQKVEIEGSTIYSDEGLPLLRTLKAIRLLRDFFASRSKQTPTIWKAAVHLFEDRLIEMAFDSVFEDNGAVKDSASSELHRIRRDILATGEKLRNKLVSLMKKFGEDGLLQENLITQRDGRSVIPVKNEHKRRISGMVHSVSQTGQTIYIEPAETIELNNELRSFEFAQQREIDRILRELTERIRSAVPAMMHSLLTCGHIEAIYAKSRYAIMIEATTPTITRTSSGRAGVLHLEEARHPFLIAKLGRSATIPFSLSLNEAHHGREPAHTLILTGPNAGGKTVLLKTTGLLLLMCHAGLPIPATSGALLPSLDGLYVDIGDQQSIADDLSTFSSHIHTLKGIIEAATERSLVLLDEIGSGTAPEEGGALAEAILEYLTKNVGFTIATTHYGRLAAFGETYPGAISGSMEFSEVDLKPTYKFRIGIPGSSHAFDIAERYEMPKRIIARAREIAGGKSSRLEELLSSLSVKEHDLAARKAASEAELGRSKLRSLEYERLLAELTSQKQKLLGEASAEAAALLAKANSFVEKAIRDVREAARPIGSRDSIPPRQPAEAGAGSRDSIASLPNSVLSQLRTTQKTELRELEKEVLLHKTVHSPEAAAGVPARGLQRGQRDAQA